ncbi:MAG: cell division protein FtsQ/DivIB [Gammaproteobacteria bacterium]|nr:cell division protein FtsQ/DivIB [Gammaproteobacteria bacterium]
MVKARRSKGATRKPVRKQRQAVAWQQWLRNMLVMSLFIGIIVAGKWLQQEDTLPILHVNVGEQFEYVDKKKLVQAVAPYVTGSFINVDVAKLREAGEALPWVKLIQVKRSWPDTLNLIVEEEKVVAQWSAHALVNEDGKLFFPTKKTFPKGLVKLTGPEGTSDVMTKQYANITTYFHRVGLRVSHLQMDKRRAWSIQFKNGMKLMLGRSDNKQRLERFVSVYKAGLQRYQAQIQTVDMRYTNGLSVVWKSGRQPDFNGTV